MRSYIYSIEKNYHGAYVIFGKLGFRQYYEYTKREAIALYNKECRKVFEGK